MFIKMFISVYKDKTTDIPGWYFSGHNICYLENHYCSTSYGWKIMNAFFCKNQVKEKCVLDFEILDY